MTDAVFSALRIAEGLLQVATGRVPEMGR